MRKLFPAVIILCCALFISCAQGKKGTKEEPKETEEISTHADSSGARPDMSADAVAEKCFENDGLKYNVRISLFFNSATTVSGSVTSTESGGGTEEKSEFTGTKNGEELTIRFIGKPPVVGDASEWTDKPWQLKTGNSSLSIIFSAKNYDTNKWADTEYKFELCR